MIACHEGLALASDLGFRKFRFASDCASMVKNIAGACMGDYGQIIMEIKAKWRILPRLALSMRGVRSFLRI